MGIYAPVQPSRLYEQIAEQIKVRILNGDLKDGDQLPTERELAERFGVSRVVVREAMKTLAQNGLVEIRPGRGTFVVSDASRAVKDSLDWMIRVGQAGTFANLIQARELLEPPIAALAARNATQEQIGEMEKVVNSMEQALNVGNLDAYIEADLGFHMLLASSTGNPLFPILINPIVDLQQEQRKHMFRVSGAPFRGQRHHKRILAAISLHAPELAYNEMTEHLKQVREDTESAMQNPG